ncbi:CHAP domain-containing protein [Sphingobacterium sp. BIGb0116]|uniref:CHAP domain-containing protein n=1 Tax=Sphingobacterium sp. BIGb0116 TaxID=2940619 RepID=UPI00216851C3|nr:CHAP domain-containing protein [Sphingobacterium sp. BIGb0116]
MATMRYLFFGFLSVAVLFLGGAGNAAIADKEQSGSYAELPSTSPGLEQVDDPSVKRYASSGVRERIVDIAVHEIGVQEATGNNDGKRVEEYLAYTGLGKGDAWCAAFVSWCYGQTGLAVPRNAWSPALFPMARRYTAQQIRQGTVRQADLFAIYSPNLQRINHVGIVRKKEGSWILTVEGNSADQVLSKRRPLITIYAFSNWLDCGEGIW